MSFKKNKKTSMRTILYVLLGIAAAGLFGMALLTGVDKTEVTECLTWQHEADVYPNYYLTKWQRQQCDAHHITINAPTL